MDRLNKQLKLFLEDKVQSCIQAAEMHSVDETKRLVLRNAERIRILIGVPFLELAHEEKAHILQMLFEAIAGGDDEEVDGLTPDDIQGLYFDFAVAISSKTQPIVK